MRRVVLAVAVVFGLGPAGAAAQVDLADYDYENLTFGGVGLDVSQIWPSKVESTTAFSMRLDLGFLGPGIRIVPSLTYWSSTMQEEELARLARRLNRLPALEDRNVEITAAELAPIDWSNLSGSVDAHFVWATPIPVFTYLGAGLGLHALNGQGDSIDDTFIEDLLDSITPALSAIAGAEYQVVERARLFAEARYVLLTDLHYPSINLGVMMKLPPRGSGQNDSPNGGAR